MIGTLAMPVSRRDVIRIQTMLMSTSLLMLTIAVLDMYVNVEWQ